MSDDYAARLLQKYGWNKGEGLGKDRQGVARPISVTSQKDTEGIGYKASFYEPWWDNLYDKTATKLSKKSNVDSVESGQDVEKLVAKRLRKQRRKEEKKLLKTEKKKKK